ncbi:MAG: GntR family transcriptional regulator [Planctomycetota bacterium]
MSAKRATTLVLHITPGSATPIYRQIVDQVRHGVAVGAMKPGDQLPSVRALAEQLVINPNTVARAYTDLVREGVIDSHQGRGYFIADRRQVYSDEECRRRLEQALDAFISETFVLNFTPDQITEAVRNKLDRIRKGKDTQRRQKND